MGKSKKRDREHEKHGVLAINGSSTAGDAQPDPEEPRKIARLAQEAPVAQAERAGVNLVEVDGKSCTHEVAWPPPPEDADPAVPSGTCANGHAMLLLILVPGCVVISGAATLPRHGVACCRGAVASAAAGAAGPASKGVCLHAGSFPADRHQLPGNRCCCVQLCMTV
jgi:hypothetical protein